MASIKQPIPILVIEDSPEDFEVLERAFKKADFSAPLYRCKNGQEALDFLYREKIFENYSDEDPSLILLDLNMPGIDGHVLLETVKDNNKLKYIPVIVLSTSSSSDDVFRSYKNGASSYIQKPKDLHGYVDMVQDIKDYWFSCCTLPAQRRNF